MAFVTYPGFFYLSGAPTSSDIDVQDIDRTRNSLPYATDMKKLKSSEK